jgi:HAD superfamily hydrolase (TIGR01490 family)
MSTSPGSTSSSSRSPSTNAGKGEETIAVFDLDGTITTRDTTAAFLLGYLREHPARLVHCLPLALSTAGFAAGLVDNADLKRAAVRAVLGGASRDEIAAWTDRFVPWCLKALVRPMARTRIEAHKSARHHLILASASLDLHVQPIAKALGFAEVICTKVAWTRGQRISGDLDGGNVRADRKLAAVQRAVSLMESEPRSARVIAYSDHHADLPLLRWADQAIAVNPTRRLAAAAAIEGIPVEDWGRP